MNKKNCCLLIFLLCLICLLSACGFSSVKPAYTPLMPAENEPPPEEQAVTESEAVELLDELFALPEETAAEAETSSSSKMLYLLNEKTICMVKSIGTDTIELSITAPDMRALFTEQIDETADNTDPIAESARITEAVLARLEASDCPMVTNEVTAELDLSDETPQIVMTEELADAMYGNILSLFDELMAK